MIRIRVMPVDGFKPSNAPIVSRFMRYWPLELLLPDRRSGNISGTLCEKISLEGLLAHYVNDQICLVTMTNFPWFSLPRLSDLGYEAITLGD